MLRTVAYWLPTVLVALILAMSGAFNVASPPEVLETTRHLGFPDWFPRWLGLWKLAAVAVLVAPGLRLAKEWAYAGVGITLSSAVVAHTGAGEPEAAVTPFVVLLVTIASWALRPADRRLQVAAPADPIVARPQRFAA